MAEGRTVSDVKYPHVWHWRQKPGYDRGSMPRVFDRDRKGERFRVLARGAMNSVLIEFEDGYRVVTSQARALPAELLLRRCQRAGRRALHAVLGIARCRGRWSATCGR
jgi:hypothetical protein